MATSKLSPRLGALVEKLEALEAVTPTACGELLRASGVVFDDVAPFVTERRETYGRRRVVRTDRYEVLVMTWRPSQGSAPHDHAGSGCTVRVVRGNVHETHFELAKDGLVDARASSVVPQGGVLGDVGPAIHLLRNDADADEALVTLHVYAPPLPELRRYVARPRGKVQAPIFTRPRHPDAGLVGIVGGGFSGTMVAAHVIRRAAAAGCPVHVALFDRHSSYGEGPAYRTVDGSHLLNVPAAKMSAWPDQPSHFLEWARTIEPEVTPYTFVPRRLFGEYVRSAFDGAAVGAPEGVTAEIKQDEVRSIERTPNGFALTGASGEVTEVSALVVATGHRPPDDPLRGRWSGPRTRYVSDPWSSLSLSAIAPEESVLILGTGLTSVDVMLTLGRHRKGKIVTLSRRGLFPEAHAPQPIAPIDASAWVKELREMPGGLTARALLRTVRREIEAAEARGENWRAVIDGMRPHTAKLWSALSLTEAKRFLRHVRGFWEVRRHRMAPKVAATISAMHEHGEAETIAGRVISATGDLDGVTLVVRRRGAKETETLRVSWVVNCTGPGVDAMSGLDPALASLLRSGDLVADPLGLGVIAGPRGEAIDERRRPCSDLIVVGTLRKPQLWESTAVPELRQQALEAAEAVVRVIGDDEHRLGRRLELAPSGGL